jgi:hypothetical protein
MVEQILKRISMEAMEKIKTPEELKALSPIQLQEMYVQLYKDAADAWFPILHVYEECPHCKGEAHILENFKKDFLRVECFNKSCEHFGKIIQQFNKGDEYYRMAISIKLGIESDSKP